MSGSVVRVLIVDDSAVVRSFITGALGRHPQIQVVGHASDGVDALKKIASLRPDVVTLDIEMPRLNGIGVLERAAGKIPVSFVVVSTLTQAGARVTFEALNKGAFDYVTKPQNAAQTTRPEFQKSLQEKVLAAARNKGRVRAINTKGVTQSAPQLPPNRATGWVVAIGISCGGPQTLNEMLPAFPSNFVPIVLTQHMPAQFTTAFAKHLDVACAMNVREATQGELLEQGKILIAPGGQHLKVVRHGAQLVVDLDGGPPVSGHRPSVDVMFRSLVQSCPSRTVAVIMTGMGRDGTLGMMELAEAGARTIGQDEESCYVYGMPKSAAEAGCVQHVVPLAKIPGMIANLIAGRERARVGRG